ncbi:toxin MazF5 [bacterium BMS3Bbin01]|nr:toxin MazF5 [bacterium BMS3Bbin01]
MNRGDVWWYEPPDRKRRPVVVLTRGEAIPFLHRIHVAPATTAVRDIPTEVGLDQADGLSRACVVSIDNLFLADPAYLTERITTLGPERMQAICEALEFALAC